MPGQQRTRQQFALLDDHEDEIWSRVANGEFIQDLVEDYDVSRSQFYKWINAGGEDRRKRRDEAREAAGDALAEESAKLLDEAAEAEIPLTSAQATIEKERSKRKAWLAGKLNPRYSDVPAAMVAVQITTGDAHLDALLKHGLPRPKEEQIEEADYELIEGEVGQASEKDLSLPSPEADQPDALDEFDDLPDDVRIPPRCMLTTYARPPGEEVEETPALVKTHPRTNDEPE